jgi:hypothetical protein
LNSKAAFFENGSVVVCCEIARYVSADQINPPKVDKELRDSIWEAYKDGLYDGIIIQAEEKQFKVG